MYTGHSKLLGDANLAKLKKVALNIEMGP